MKNARKHLSSVALAIALGSLPFTLPWLEAPSSLSQHVYMAVLTGWAG